MSHKQETAELLHSLVPELSAEQIFPLLERPKREEQGDIAFPCFQVAKLRRLAPPAVAAEIAKALSGKLSPTFQSVEAAGPYVNFRLSPAAALAIAREVLERKEKFGSSRIGAGKKVLIEYSSPNVAKELHIGHFRNTVLGQSLNNIYKATGHETISVNHLGDWGSQFGKVAYGYLNHGDEAEMMKNPLGYLTKLYVQVNQEEESDPSVADKARRLFKKIEEGDPELTALWKKFKDLSIEGLKRVYARLGVTFDHYIGESFYVDKIDALLTELRKKNLLVESEGAQVVSLGEDVPPCLILTGDGTSLYATRDLAAAIWRQQKFGADQTVYVIGSEQQLHTKQFFQVLSLMGYPWAGTLQHVHYGLYRFKDGKFSTRKGRVVLAEEVLDEARAKALELINAKNPKLASKEEVAEIVGVGAVVFNDLSTDRVKDVEFDWDRILDFEGDTGPYLQYCYARAGSILRQAAAKGILPGKLEDSKEIAGAESALMLMKQFGQLEASLEGALRLQKPSIIANYAIDLAKKFNAFYREVRVVDESAPAETAGKLALVQAFRQVLGNTLALLCMRVPEEM